MNTNPGKNRPARMIYVVGILMVVNVIGKMVGVRPMVEGLTNIGMGNYIYALAAAELIFAGLFLFPKTFRIGFILLSCYFGGAIATHISHSDSIINLIKPIVFLSVIWIAAFLNDRSVFLID